ncbi:MAG: alpha-ketoacid dehydrogenase subunit beta [Saccharofermentanales bacterium]|jgi:pyruvate/2-oxoglutarate/acetoin dehydrogenase E1 component
MSKKNIIKALNEALREEMLRDDSVYITGEDVGRWGSIYTVTKGLFEEFGPERVIDMPICENLISCMPIGMALMGMRPVVEIMFADFAMLQYDGIANQAAKMHFVSNGANTCPIVYRAAQGAGGGNSSQHSQCIESWFMNIPGLIIISPSDAYDAKGLLKSAIRNDNPILFLEHKTMYAETCDVPDEEYTIPIGKARILQEGKDVTLIANQKMLKFAKEAIERLEKEGKNISVELIDPRTIKPYDADAFCASASKTGRVIIVHENCLTGGYAGEFAFAIQERCLNDLKKPIKRIAALDSSLPAGKMDMYCLPDVDEIYQAIVDIMN